MPATLPSFHVVAFQISSPMMKAHVADMVRALVAAGHRVEVWDTQGEAIDPSWEESGATCRSLAMRVQSGSERAVHQSWFSALKDFRGWNAILCRGVAGETPFAVVSAMKRQYRRIYTIEYSFPREASHSEGMPAASPGLIDRLCRPYLKHVAEAAIHRSIALSAQIRQAMINDLGYEPGKVHTAYPWIDVERFKVDAAARQRQRMQLAVDDQTLVIGNLDHHRAEKRTDLIIRGFAEWMSKTSRPAVLALAAPGEMQEKVGKLARDLVPPQKLRLIQNPQERAAWLNAMDVYVRASVSESLGLSVLQAMACGCVVMAHPAGGVREFIQHGYNGLAVEMERPETVAVWLETIASKDPSVRGLMTEYALKSIANRFSPRGALAFLLDTLEQPAAADLIRRHDLVGATPRVIPAPRPTKAAAG